MTSHENVYVLVSGLVVESYHKQPRRRQRPNFAFKKRKIKLLSCVRK